MKVVGAANSDHDKPRVKALWARYEASPHALKQKAAARVAALQSVEQLTNAGCSLMDARNQVAERLRRESMPGGSVSSLARWAAEVRGLQPNNWLPALVPAYVGRATKSAIPAAAWDLFKADFLRLEAPSATSCYERLTRVAKVEGWVLPSLRTFERRISCDLSPQVIVLARRGIKALDQLYPAQERDRSSFTALQAVNADGHRFDVFVRLSNGKVIRPLMICLQDLYSGKLLAWRLGETESADLARLTFRDLVERYGIPDHAWLDNGRGFASKVLTGGASHRFRFKVKNSEPVGMLTSLGIEVHWTTPYHGQAKPIERAFRDLCDRVAKHPAFSGAYTGNRHDTKPENYGSNSIPLEVFSKILAEEIAAHNERPGRRSSVCKGRSFNNVFTESYGSVPIRRATREQLRDLLLATEAVTLRRPDGTVVLAGNRYWAEPLVAHAGRKTVVRFDPDAMHSSINVYSQAGVLIAEAPCLAAVGFADTQAAKEHARAKKAMKRTTREQLQAERRLGAAEVANRLPPLHDESCTKRTVIAPLFGLPRASPETRTQNLATNEAREHRFQRIMAQVAADQLGDRHEAT